MKPSDTVTDWIRLLQAGNSTAATGLWERYFSRMVNLARRQLGAIPRRAADEEDVALEAFDCFCRAAAEGRFPDLNDRDGLWQVLVALTVNKTIDLIHYSGREKRTWRRTQFLTDSVPGDGGGALRLSPGLLEGGEPDPAFTAEVADNLNWLLKQLGDEQLRRIAVLKLEGYTNPEIARMLNCNLSTVERRLRLIRRHLKEHMTDDGGDDDGDDTPLL